METFNDKSRPLLTSGKEDDGQSAAQSSATGFIAYARRTIAKLKAAGKPVAANYQAALNSFIRFHGEAEVPFSQFDQDLMTAYECYLRGIVCRNSSSCYMRNLHAIYNRAIDDGLAPENLNPFRRVYTGIDKTDKRAIGIQSIIRIMNADLSGHPAMSFARDMFMFSFFTQGMSIIDMAWLTEDNLKDGMLIYRRHKTQQTIRMKCADEIVRLIGKYSYVSVRPFILPILSTADPDKSKMEYKAAVHRIDRNLRQLGQMLGLPIRLTMYVARHSWASIAWSHNVPVATISRCLGHDSERTTVIYLADIECPQTYKANEIVLRSLRQTKKPSR